MAKQPTKEDETYETSKQTLDTSHVDKAVFGKSVSLEVSMNARFSHLRSMLCVSPRATAASPFAATAWMNVAEPGAELPPVSWWFLELGFIASSLHPWYPWHLLGIARNKTWSISRGRPRALWTASNISCSPLGQPILASAGFGKTWKNYTSSGGWNIQKNLSTSQHHQHISTQYSWLRPDFGCVINSNTSTARWDAASRPESTRSICWRRWWKRSSPPALLHRFGSWVWVQNWGSKGTADLGCLDNSESTSQDHAKKQHLEQRGCWTSRQDRGLATYWCHLWKQEELWILALCSQDPSSTDCQTCGKRAWGPKGSQTSRMNFGEICQ